MIRSRVIKSLLLITSINITFGLLMDLSFTSSKKQRVLINTDAKNEADDQYAIVHAILTPSFELHGIIPAHFGDHKCENSVQASREEVDLLLRLMDLDGRIRVEDGAPDAMPNEQTPVDSPGARLIIAEALRDDPRPLNVLFMGPLTDMASALLLEPRIAERNVRIIWIGGGDYPEGGWEYNLSNDIHAANVVFNSSLELWQMPQWVYRLVAVSYAELVEKVYPHGQLGRYLVEQLIDYNEQNHEQAMEYRSLGDSPAVGVVLYPNGGRWEMIPAPDIDVDMSYRHNGQNRPIRVYSSFDARFLMEDFFAKLARFAREIK